MVLDVLHKVTIRFFQTWSRLSPMDEGPCGERDRLLEEGVVLESCGLWYGTVCVCDGEDE